MMMEQSAQHNTTQHNTTQHNTTTRRHGNYMLVIQQSANRTVMVAVWEKRRIMYATQSLRKRRRQLRRYYIKKGQGR